MPRNIKNKNKNKNKNTTSNSQSSIMRPSQVKTVSVPSSISCSSSNVLSSASSVRIRHTEMIGTFVTVTANTPESAGNFQPGVLFPWCSGIARNFEKYEPHFVRIRYVPTSPTNTVGGACMLFDTDPYDVLPGSISEMMSSSLSVSGPAWAPLEINLPSHLLKSYHRYYTRPGYVEGDLKTYDLGKLIIANTMAEVTTGMIFVDYDITFHVPQIAIIPSGHIEDNSPLAGNNNAYGLGDTVISTGNVPAKLSWPTAEQVVEGAKVGFKLLNLAANSQGTLTTMTYGNTGTMTPFYEHSDSLELAPLSGILEENSKNYEIFKYFTGNKPSWFQPYAVDAANIINSIMVMFAAGKYSKLDI